MKKFLIRSNEIFFSPSLQINFWDNFTALVKVLYTDPILKYKKNGLVLKSCSMSRGTKQGCPILALYLFAAEISALKLKTIYQIKSIQLSDTSMEIEKTRCCH